MENIIISQKIGMKIKTWKKKEIIVEHVGTSWVSFTMPLRSLVFAAGTLLLALRPAAGDCIQTPDADGHVVATAATLAQIE